MPDGEPQSARAAAAEINELILDLWIATERNGPSYEEFDLTSQQHAVLGLVISRPGMTPRELSDALGVTKGAISQHLGVLEREGYISRQRSDHDRRVQVLDLEKRGQEYRDRLRQFEQRAVDRYLAVLGCGELAEIITALKKLKSALGDDATRTGRSAAI